MDDMDNLDNPLALMANKTQVKFLKGLCQLNYRFGGEPFRYSILNLAEYLDTSDTTVKNCIQFWRPLGERFGFLRVTRQAGASPAIWSLDESALNAFILAVRRFSKDRDPKLIQKALKTKEGIEALYRHLA